jgi:hypothetical protein
MTRRTTVTANAEDFAVLEREAQLRGISMAQMFRELIAREAHELRVRRRPRFPLFRSGGGENLADLSWQDEDAPYRDQFGE